MGSEWRQYRLGDLGSFRNGANFSRSDYGAGFPIVNVKQLYASRYVGTESLLRVTSSAIANPENLFLKRGDILFARSSVKGSGAGQAAMVFDCPENTIFSGFIIRFRVEANETVLPLFLNYLLRSDVFRELLTRIASGTTITNLSQGTLASLPISLPPLFEQQAVVNILGSLDDKIELNRKMNETLEEMARAIFKSWFVDFDPVHAKAEGRDASVPPEIADLFPDSFEDSDLGEIPKGWREGTLSDLAELNPENWSKGKRPTVIEYVDLSGTKWGNIDSVSTYAEMDAPSRAQRVLRQGDTIIGTVRPGNGSYALVSDPGLTGSTGFAVLRPRQSDFTEFTYLAASSRRNIDRLSRLADGAAYPAVRPDVVANTEIVVPSEDILACFSDSVVTLFARAAMSKRESKTLISLRDSLLPELLSGKLKVSP